MIGPSWENISKRYSNNPEAGNRLASSVLHVSGGKLGTEKIPPADLVDSIQAAEIVQLIIQLGGDKKVEFLPGLSGAFETVRRPKDDTGKAVYFLTAKYTNRGGAVPGSYPDKGKLLSCCGVSSKIRSVRRSRLVR